MAGRSEPSAGAFFGRATELAWLLDRLEAALAGRPSLALVVGEAGIGKTRLVDEAARMARARGVHLLRSGATAPARAVVGVWAGIDGSRRPDGALDAGEDRRWAILEDLAATLAASAPGIVVLEDVHWADDASTWLLERMVGALGDAAVLLVATARRHELGAADLSSLRSAADVVELAGLDLASATELVAARSTRGPAEAEALWRLTGGNPLFLRELLLLPAGEAATGRTPAAVAEVLDRVLAGLPPATRDALAALAVTGAATPLRVVERAAGFGAGELLDELGRAAALDVVSTEGRPTFRHELLRVAALRAVPPGRVRELHAALGGELERSGTSATALAQAVRHRLAALPLGDAAETAETALRSMQRLTDAGDPASAADLGSTAVASLEAFGDVPGAVLAQLEVGVADALTTLGDATSASPRYERAAARLASDGDVVWRARAEVGACRQVNVFVPDPVRLERLVALEAAMPADANPLRVELLGRLAVLAAATPGRRPAAQRHGDAAIELARQLGDPALLVGALADRHFAPVGADGLRAREAAGEEIVALGVRLGRPDLELRGVEWVFGDRLDRGDRPGSERALDRLELLAEIMPSPFWRYSARIRRAGQHVVEGNRVAALWAIADASTIGTGVISEMERLGLELAGRVALLALWPGTDERARAVYDRLVDYAASFTSPFVLIQMARAAAVVLGDDERATDVVTRFGPRAGSLVDDVAGLMTVAHLAELAASIGDASCAAPLRAALTPHRNRLAVGNGAAVHLPVAAQLGRLALLQGDAAAAVRDLRDAVRLVAAMPAPVLVAHCTRHLAVAQRAAGDDAAADETAARAATLAAAVGIDDMATAASPSSTTPSRLGHRAPPAASMRRIGASWHVVTPHGDAFLPATLAVTQLARLLALPGVAIPAVEVAGDGGPARDLGPTLDARAKREFRRRIAELRREIDEARADNDPGRVDAAEAELDVVMAALRSAVGLGGRDRPSGSGAERARVNVTRNVRRAITLVGEQLPGLGAHLERSVRTGAECCYDPEPATALRWEISA